VAVAGVLAGKVNTRGRTVVIVPGRNTTMSTLADAPFLG